MQTFIYNLFLKERLMLMYNAIIYLSLKNITIYYMFNDNIAYHLYLGHCLTLNRNELHICSWRWKWELIRFDKTNILPFIQHNEEEAWGLYWIVGERLLSFQIQVGKLTPVYTFSRLPTLTDSTAEFCWILNGLWYCITSSFQLIYRWFL